jgi:outer membrane lipoprotein SlyB
VLSSKSLWLYFDIHSEAEFMKIGQNSFVTALAGLAVIAMPAIAPLSFSNPALSATTSQAAPRAAQLAPSVCSGADRCGTVTDVRTIQVRGQGSGAGVVVGGVLGGVLGHQIGGGRGRDVATVAGAAGGAYAGHQTERNMKSGTRYQVQVQLQNGKSRTFTFRAPTSYRVGDAIAINGGKLVRR